MFSWFDDINSVVLFELLSKVPVIWRILIEGAEITANKFS